MNVKTLKMNNTFLSRTLDDIKKFLIKKKVKNIPNKWKIKSSCDKINKNVYKNLTWSVILIEHDHHHAFIAKRYPLKMM